MTFSIERVDPLQASSGTNMRVKITAGKFSVSKAEQLVERRIGQLDAALLVQHHDSERTIFDQRIQMDGLFLQVKRNTMTLAYGRADDQSDSGNHQHEKADLGGNAGTGGKICMANTMPKLRASTRGDHAANSLPHGNPDDGNKAQEKLLA